MRNATILYQAGSAGAPVTDPEVHIAAAGLDPCWTEWATGGPSALNEALLRLATRGAQRIEAVPAQFTEAGKLHLGSPRIRMLG